MMMQIGIRIAKTHYQSKNLLHISFSACYGHAHSTASSGAGGYTLLTWRQQALSKKELSHVLTLPSRPSPVEEAPRHPQSMH